MNIYECFIFYNEKNSYKLFFKNYLKILLDLISEIGFNIRVSHIRDFLFFDKKSQYFLLYYKRHYLHNSLQFLYTYRILEILHNEIRVH